MRDVGMTDEERQLLESIPDLSQLDSGEWERIAKCMRSADNVTTGALE